MAVNYGITGEQSLLIVGPTNISVSGSSQPVIATVETPEGISIDPSTAAMGDPDLTMTVTGTGFAPYSKITFNGSPEETVFVSETELTTVVKPSTASMPVEVPVTVKNGSRVSNMVGFTFTGAGRSRK